MCLYQEISGLNRFFRLKNIYLHVFLTYMYYPKRMAGFKKKYLKLMAAILKNGRHGRQGADPDCL